eukprot:1193447-Prorocentrum_minimum.AAC.2
MRYGCQAGLSVQLDAPAQLRPALLGPEADALLAAADFSWRKSALAKKSVRGGRGGAALRTFIRSHERIEPRPMCCALRVLCASLKHRPIKRQKRVTYPTLMVT